MSWEYMIIHDLIGVDGFNLTLMARRPEMVTAVTALFHLCVPRIHPSSFQQFSQWITPVDGYGYITWKNATAPENPETNTKGYSDI